jgi:hypothetical protein
MLPLGLAAGVRAVPHSVANLGLSSPGMHQGSGRVAAFLESYKAVWGDVSEELGVVHENLRKSEETKDDIQRKTTFNGIAWLQQLLWAKVRAWKTVSHQYAQSTPRADPLFRWGPCYAASSLGVS